MKTPKIILYGIALFAFILTNCDRSQHIKSVVANNTTIEMIGEKFQWYIKYPGLDGQLNTKDDIITHGLLHLPENVTIKIILTSKDYLYNIFLPDSKIKYVAIPDQQKNILFTTASPGKYRVLGDQMCGSMRPKLVINMIVETPENFYWWLLTPVK